MYVCIYIYIYIYIYICRRAGNDAIDAANKNNLIPREGYFASPYFTRNPDHAFGTKRYAVWKPDDTKTRVRIEARIILAYYNTHIVYNRSTDSRA